MRTIGEIIQAVEEQEPVADQELRLTLLSLWRKLQVEVKCLDSANRVHKLFQFTKQDPEKYLGPRWIPNSTTNREFQALSKKIMKLIKRDQND